MKVSHYFIPREYTRSEKISSDWALLFLNEKIKLKKYFSLSGQFDEDLSWVKGGKGTILGFTRRENIS